MALQPYGTPLGGQQLAQPYGTPLAGQQLAQPYGTPLAGQQLAPQQLQQVDPFANIDAMFNQMMMSPFGGMGPPGSRQSYGPGMGGMGGIFGAMDQMMNEMMAMEGGPGGAMGPGGMGGQMMQMGGPGGDGGFSFQTMMVSSTVGDDGQQHIERFASSSIGDRARNIAEVQQAYANSATGMDKMSLERQMADRGRKMVKERNKNTGEERNTDLFRGMTEAQTADFDTQWQQNAVPYLPRHANMGQLMAGQPAATQALPPAYQPAISYSQPAISQPAISYSQPGISYSQPTSSIPAAQTIRSAPVAAPAAPVYNGLGSII